MFLCPKCKNKMTLPTCSCGYTVRRQNMIWQLSDMPDIVIDGDGDKYIGYEHIGESYSGGRKYLIEEQDTLFAKDSMLDEWITNNLDKVLSGAEEAKRFEKIVVPEGLYLICETGKTNYPTTLFEDLRKKAVSEWLPITK